MWIVLIIADKARLDWNQNIVYSDASYVSNLSAKQAKTSKKPRISSSKR